MFSDETGTEVKMQFPPDVEARKFSIVVYTGDLTIVGSAVLTVDIRSSSRRTSDFMRTLKANDFLTLGEVKVVDRQKNKIIDKPPYMLVNLKNVQGIYAQEDFEVISEGRQDDKSSGVV